MHALSRHRKSREPAAPRPERETEARRLRLSPVPDRLPAVVPAYFHPTVRPEDWDALAERAGLFSLVVLNLANGPGDRRDDAFLPPLDRLRAAGVAVAGYVDTDYGRRSTDAALADVDRYLDWYGVTGVMFDRAAADADHVGRYLTLARCARVLGAGMVAFNHGAHPVEAYADHADLLGTFEGPWRAYLEVAVPRWVRSRPAGRFYHLVHTVPHGRMEDAHTLAARRHVGAVYVTDRGAPNPWDCLPAGYRLASTNSTRSSTDASGSSTSS